MKLTFVKFELKKYFYSVNAIEDLTDLKKIETIWVDKGFSLTHGRRGKLH